MHVSNTRLDIYISSQTIFVDFVVIVEVVLEVWCASDESVLFLFYSGLVGHSSGQVDLSKWVQSVWVSGEDEVCELLELGGSWSGLGKYGVCVAEISFSNKVFFSAVCRLRKFLMSLSINVLGIRRPEDKVSVLVRSLLAM